MIWPFRKDKKILFTKVERMVNQLPRHGGIHKGIEQQKQRAKEEGFTDVKIFALIESMGDLCQVDSMYNFSASFKEIDQEVTPVLLVKLSTTGQELFQIIRAVKEGQLAFGAEALLDGACPILRTVLLIADNPENLFLQEGLSDIAHEDLQNYVMALKTATRQEFVLYRGDNSMAAHISLRVDDGFRELYLETFLDVANAYGQSLRSREEWHSTATIYQMTHRVTMPPQSVKLRLV